MIEKIYQLIKADQAQFPARALCETLGVSHSGFYDWIKRPPSLRIISNHRLTEQILAIHRGSDFDGRPRVPPGVADLGILANHKRVGELMRKAKIRSKPQTQLVITTHRNEGMIARQRIWCNVISKQPTSNQLWVADMTPFPPGQDFCIWPWLSMYSAAR
ncbi:MAG: hypothetical protein KIT26_08605 [Nitrosomonas sp.]|nr:hypothetical protein [Nitrosomonas sp.]